MKIKINGAFGVGKTTVASKLLERIPKSMLFDLEEVVYISFVAFCCLECSVHVE